MDKCTWTCENSLLIYTLHLKSEESRSWWPDISVKALLMALPGLNDLVIRHLHLVIHHARCLFRETVASASCPLHRSESLKCFTETEHAGAAAAFQMISLCIFCHYLFIFFILTKFQSDIKCYLSDRKISVTR